MAYIELPSGSDPDSIKLLSLPSPMTKVMATASENIYGELSLDSRVREAIRMKIALINQCQLCLSFRFPELEKDGIDENFYHEVAQWKQSSLLNAREKCVIEFTELFINDHLALTAENFKSLSQFFTDIEIFEITTCIAYLMANGRILQVLQIEQACELN